MAETIIICSTVVFVCITAIILSLIYFKRGTVQPVEPELDRAREENRAAQQSITEAESTVADCRRTSEELGELTKDSRRLLEEIGKQAVED